VLGLFCGAEEALYEKVPFTQGEIEVKGALHENLHQLLELEFRGLRFQHGFRLLHPAFLKKHGATSMPISKVADYTWKSRLESIGFVAKSQKRGRACVKKGDIPTFPWGKDHTGKAASPHVQEAAKAQNPLN
jgi:hypothetical protein